MVCRTDWFGIVRGMGFFANLLLLVRFSCIMQVFHMAQYHTTWCLNWFRKSLEAAHASLLCNELLVRRSYLLAAWLLPQVASWKGLASLKSCAFKLTCCCASS